jgi:ATP/maltotriose-dependent transcriptional regulator MalT
MTARGGWREDILPVALDDNRVWYRYHHLFADFLRENLEREGSEPLAPLRLRAYERCEDYGLVAEARWRAVSASGRDRAADGK